MIYLDNAATTPLCDAAKEAIIEHLDDFGNPSSSYELGYKAKMLIEDARERIANCINANPDEIYFTSGGSEADTWALRGRNSLASNIEHHAIHSTFRFKVNNEGLVNFENIKELIKDHSIRYKPIEIVSCMAVNNEIGTILPIKEIAKVSHDNGVLFHTDAVQALGHIPVDVKDICCDMLSASGHKFGAPKGVGFLFVKNGIEMKPLIYGGKQESGIRGSTENVLGIIAMAAALEDAVVNIKTRNEHIRGLRNRLLGFLLTIDGVVLNGPLLANRIDSNINIRIEGVKGQDVVALADQYGICISAGSACNEGSDKPSHVLKAIGLTNEEAQSSIRITLGYQNTEEEIDYAFDFLTKFISRLRSI
ncbi:MAG: cysteine desulfurase family protein [Lachnospiraceae bacterium]